LDSSKHADEAHLFVEFGMYFCYEFVKLINTLFYLVTVELPSPSSSATATTTTTTTICPVRDAFFGCESLTSIVIPKGVITISNNAFF
jgi:hypothetical protein